jgi:hypothetical protein
MAYESKASRRILWSLVLLLCIAIPLVTGCASPAQSRNMIPESYEMVNRHNNSAKLSVEGGKRTSAIDRSQIANEDFMSALEESIKKSGVFQQVIKDGDADYLLEVFILGLDQPIAGFNMEVKIATNWKITEMRSQKEVWQKNIITNHTATVGDAFAGVARVRVANEGAAKKNIQRGIAELSRINLKDCC